MADIYKITPEELQILAKKAIDAKKGAYCPYSNFRVGACLLIDSPTPSSAIVGAGVYHSGANVEVASTPVGICAERCAMAPLVASYDRPSMPVIRAIAISSDISPGASPCGMCRQFIREFCEPDMPIYMYDSNDDWEKYEMKTIGELLPMSFGRWDKDAVKGAKSGEEDGFTKKYGERKRAEGGNSTAEGAAII